MAWSSTFGTTPTVTSVSDNVGNIYQEAGNARAVDTSAQQMVDIWYAKNSTVGATTLTINPNPSGNTGGAVIWEFSNVDTVSPLDQTAVLNSQPATATPSGAPVTTTAPAELIISVMVPGGSLTGLQAGSPFTNDATFFGTGWAHLMTSTAGTYAPQWNTSSGTFTSSTVSFRAAGAGGFSSCDLNQDGKIDDSDRMLAINMALGLTACTANIVGPSICNIVTVQRVINAEPGNLGVCVTGASGATPHSVLLSWTPSTSPNVVGQKVYRGTGSGGPYTLLTSSLVTGTSFTDNAVQAGQTYFYVVTAVDNNNNESVYSNQASSVIPTP